MLPALTLASYPAGVAMRLTRSAMIEILERRHIAAARALGLPSGRILFGHALPNAMGPALTVIGLSFAYALTGAVLVEIIFAWPGLGRYVSEAILAKDFPVIAAVTMVVTVCYVIDEPDHRHRAGAGRPAGGADMRRLVHRLGWPGTIALACVLGFIAVGILAPWIAPYPAQGAGAPNVAAKLTGPSADYWLGTDHLGPRHPQPADLRHADIAVERDADRGLLAADRPAGGIGRGLFRRLGGRGADADDRCLPGLPGACCLAVLMAAALGPGFLNSIIAVSVTWWPWYARLARAEGLVLRGQPYVEAAQLAGVSHPRIILRHILPATARPLTVQAALDVGPALLTAAALSFLGLGVLPPTADWGQMVDAGRKFFPDRWWYSAMPGVTIFIVALAFSVLGDALRDRRKGAARAPA
ncbi:MAG: ABC transporter permease subunit [Ilumatobacteraceae bacterium]